MVTVTVDPPLTVVLFTASVGVAPLSVTAGLVARRVKPSLAKRRSSKGPAVVGMVKIKVPPVSPVPGALLVPLRYFQSTKSLLTAPCRKSPTQLVRLAGLLVM